MDILKIISIALSAIIIIILVRKINGDYALFISCVINIFICIFSFGILIPVFDYVKELHQSTHHGGLYSIILKSTGICMLSSLASELCRDLGEASIAEKIEFAGKCTITAFCLPLIQKVFENAMSFIS